MPQTPPSKKKHGGGRPEESSFEMNGIGNGNRQQPHTTWVHYSWWCCFVCSVKENVVIVTFTVLFLADSIISIGEMPLLLCQSVSRWMDGGAVPEQVNRIGFKLIHGDRIVCCKMD